ncbi:enoyl-CoA hydratase/isomerase family protein [Nocardioides sp.]|uniref:enoyl-CoA hydratase/isomerase family protein n=1 Tax=Nocardioides sp. TaxID=35761 RepID=UPI0027371931|nr:enoyl-CoA hydratase/isomerase family protein [Nocardioides sp.]MDP3891465.1 enoyl-CoA hydratase/isomerase family protein [Nocardioides sp.]
MTDHIVHTATRGRVGWVTYDRASRGNSFTEPALADLVAALEGLAGDESVSCIRLEMAGRHFCTGWDTADFGRLAASPQAEIEESLRANDRTLERVRRLPVPVVAAVRGRVAGFGAGLLAAVQVPIGSTTTSLALPEVGFGISPAGVLHALVQRLPLPAVHLMTQSGTVADSEEMLRWGLLARVVADADLDDSCESLVTAMAQAPGSVLRTISAAVHDVVDAGSPEPAYAAAARSILTGTSKGEAR